MSRKHYNQLAMEFRQELSNSLTPKERAAVIRMAVRVSAALAATCPGFMRAKFLESCGVPQND